MTASLAALMAEVEALAPASKPVILSGDGTLANLGRLVGDIGKNPALLVGSYGYGVVAETLEASFKKQSLPLVVRRHVGYCTFKAVQQHVLDLASCKPDVIVAVGGGRVLDTGKLVAQKMGLPVVCVPTSAATCAAVTNVSVPYTAEGACSGGFTLDTVPQLVVLDLTVLRRAPPRLSAAGIADAGAKYHEVRLAANSSPSTERLALALKVCGVLWDMLCENGTSAATFGPTPSDEILESVIVLPGLASALAGEANRVAIAHLIHNLATRHPHSPTALHGEIVACGVLCQLIFEGNNKTFRVQAEHYRRLNLPFTLSQLGFDKSIYHPLAASVVQSSITRKFFPNLSDSDVQEAFLVIEETGKSALTP